MDAAALFQQPPLLSCQPRDFPARHNPRHGAGPRKQMKDYIIGGGRECERVECCPAVLSLSLKDYHIVLFKPRREGGASG